MGEGPGLPDGPEIEERRGSQKEGKECKPI